MKELANKLRNSTKFKKVAYWSLVLSMFLYVFSIPTFSAMNRWFIISYFCMFAFSTITIVYTYLYNNFKFNRLFIIPIVFVCYAFVGTLFFSHEFRDWFTLVLMLLTLFVFYWAFIAIDNTRLSLKTIIFAFLAFAVAFIIAYFPDVSHFNIEKERIKTIFDNANTIGFYFSIATTLSVYIALNWKKRIEWLFFLAALLFFFLSFFTGSRAFVVVMFAGIITAAFFKFKRKALFVAFVISLIVVFIIIINLPPLAEFKDRIDRALHSIFGIGEAKDETSAIQRTIWPFYGFFLAGKNLLIGYGCSGFAEYSGIGTYAHNNYAETACNFGIIGLFTYYLMHFVPVWLSIKSKKEDVYLTSVWFMLYFARGFFGVTYYSKETYMAIAMCFYLVKDCQLPSFEKRVKKKEADNLFEVSI